MDVPDQPLLNPEHVTVRHRLGGISPVQSRETHEYDHDPHHLVDNISSVGDFDSRWEATDITGICREVSPAGVCLPS